nr:MAG TPA: HIRAN protein [Bacteriophage sp.]
MSRELPLFLQNLTCDITDCVFTLKLVGSTFQYKAQDVLQVILDNNMVDKVILELVREPDNIHDEHAVKVMLSVDGYSGTYHVGYVSRDISETISFLLQDDDLCVHISDVFMSGGGLDYYVGLMFNCRFNRKE